MKSYINRLFSVLCVGVLIGMASCVGDLDVKPSDPNQDTADKFAADPDTYLRQVMARCYSSLAVSSQGGESGSADLAGLDGGYSQYERALFMLNEFSTDEVKWIWPDEGVYDLNTNTAGTNNANIYGTYSRFFVHISVCNEFLRLVNNLGYYGIEPSAELQANIEQWKVEARILRAYSYYNLLDLYGNVGFITDEQEAGARPVQTPRAELFAWLEKELIACVDAMPATQPIYGRVGKDAAEALLARLYLNAEVFAGTNRYADCATRCQNIIARHQGGGYEGSGLAKNYLGLFAGTNDRYMPGGSNTAENEILFGVPFESTNLRCWGATMFLEAAAYHKATWESDGFQMNPLDYGLNASWQCMHATSALSEKFEANPEDLRWSMWCKEDRGFFKENTQFSAFNYGYAAIKFTNLNEEADGSLVAPASAPAFPDTDMPIIRLADVYLMYAECAARGNADQATGLKYANYVRGRAGVTAWTSLNLDNILDERARELYWENVRRTDLVRFGKFTGGVYNWPWKGGDVNGVAIPAHMNLYPIPSKVLADDNSFVQNPGY